MTIETLSNLVHSVEPAAQLVEARILRRVIRLDRRLPGFGLSVLRRRSYTIERERLLTFVEWAELDLPPAADLPRMVILLARPLDDELSDPAQVERVLQRYARLLYHESVHAELSRHASDEASLGAWAAVRRDQIGEIEFAEIRTVLLKDEQLFTSPSDLETYSEFLATYLELRYFAPRELAIYFPGVRDWDEIDRIASLDIDHARLFERQRFPAETFLLAPSDEAAEQSRDRLPIIPRVSRAEFRRMQARAERAASIGNLVKAAITHTRAARLGPIEHAAEAHQAARKEIEHMVQRLQPLLQLNEQDSLLWSQALTPLLEPAADGFWTTEARLLYDLQKACIEQERGVYRLDLVEWIRTLGRRPIRRPLPLLRDALIIRQLRTANRRVRTARIENADRDLLTQLISVGRERIENRSREQIRPVMTAVFEDVGLVPQNVPERIALRKLVEELLDRVVEHRYFSMADVRDALSKNELKLPDVATLADLAQGDRLLRADKKLDAALDGVYRRGAIYQRWPQSISSIAFGTDFGRFLTKYLALPYGGAYLALAFIEHFALLLTGRGHAAHGPNPLHPEEAGEIAKLPQHVEHAGPDFLFYFFVLALGTWLSLLIHNPAFRAWNVAVLEHAWRIGKRVLIDLPTQVINSKFVQQILHSQAYAALHNYVLRPAVVTGLICAGLWLADFAIDRRLAFEIFLVVDLLLNSPIGRYLAELTTDMLVRAFHELRMRVIADVVQWIMATFQGFLLTLERLVYMVDEWLLFRAGDGRALQGIKLVGGVVWFFVAYVVVFVFTLLIEPQVNPIKHFPVVTVSHKLILPTGPMLVAQLTPYIGRAEANTLVWTTIWLIPGVFGFLVWELKENWRLYAANRARTLRPSHFGEHGETMVRMLRPGFHSGTLPKAFTALRRAARKTQRTGMPSPITHRLIAIKHVERDVRRFVERELLNLLEEAHFLPCATLAIGDVRNATNRIDVELTRSDMPELPMVLTWEDNASVLVGQVSKLGWLKALSASDLTTFTMALAGIFQRSGVDEVRGPLVIDAEQEITWRDWVAYWSPASPSNSPPEPMHLLPAADQHGVTVSSQYSSLTERL